MLEHRHPQPAGLMPSKSARRRVICAVCEAPQPRVRIPKNYRQLMYGGMTCAKCGTELTSFGQPRT